MSEELQMFDTLEEAQQAAETSGQVQPKEIVKVMSESKANKLIDAVLGGMGKVLKSIWELMDGNGDKALGYDTWKDFCWNVFGWSENHSYKMKQYARLYHETQLALPEHAQSTLNRMPDDSLAEMKDLHPEQRSIIIEHFASEETVPSVLQVLEEIPESQLSGRQVKLRTKLRAKANGVEDFYPDDFGELGRKYIKAVWANLDNLNNPDVIAALGYETYSDLARGEFAQLEVYFSYTSILEEETIEQ